jgi:hypothetical protein
VSRLIDVLEHPGLFIVPLEWPRAMQAAANTLEPTSVRPERARGVPTNRRENSGIHRHCSSCARETEHVAWVVGRGSIPLIRWPVAEPASGTTICLNCGQWRTATSQPRPPAWSSWPESAVAPKRLADATDSADTPDDSVSETAAENEGMPPRRERQRPRRIYVGQQQLNASASGRSATERRMPFWSFRAMERTGIEPVTSGLQSRRSPS